MKLNNAGFSMRRVSPVSLSTSSTAVRLREPSIRWTFVWSITVDVRRRLDALRQIAGHLFVQAVAADDQEDPAGVLREENGGLAGGVAARPRSRRLPGADLRLGEGRA